MAERQPAGTEEHCTVRGAIEQQALEIFSRKGYHAASIRDIVEAAGVTAPTLYYHYGSKEGLYSHLLDQAIDRLRQRIDAARAAGRGIRSQLVTIVQGHIEALLQRPAEVRFLHRAILSTVLQGSSPAQLLHGRMEQLPMPGIFLEALARGELAPVRPDLLLNAFIGAINMYVGTRIFMICEGKEQLELGMCPSSVQGMTEGLETSMEDAERIVDLFLAGASSRREAQR